jgi:predicted DNA-binding protein
VPLVSIRLPEEVEAQLAREAARAQRPKSEIARDAIVDYLERLERDRFFREIARAARDRGNQEALEVAAEALPLDNEALDVSEGIREPRPAYRAPNKRPRKRKVKR